MRIVVYIRRIDYSNFVKKLFLSRMIQKFPLSREFLRIDSSEIDVSLLNS